MLKFAVQEPIYQALYLDAIYTAHGSNRRVRVCRLVTSSTFWSIDPVWIVRGSYYIIRRATTFIRAHYYSLLQLIISFLLCKQAFLLLDQGYYFVL